MLLRLLLLPLFALAGEARAQVSYATDDAVIANPERGWMWTVKPFCETLDIEANTDFAALRAEGVTLIDQVYVLDDFRDSALSQAFLDGFAADCGLVRDQGFKLVPRFTYNWIENCTGPEDASLERTLGHLDQLEAIFREHEDVIAHLQVSFIGRFGEQHTSSSGHVIPGDTRMTKSGLAIADRVLEVLPVSRSWSMRYPQARAQRHPALLPEDRAFEATNDARTGLANHGFASDPTDFGTWSADPEVRAREQTYAEGVTRWTPMVGEPGGALFEGEDPSPAESQSQLERFHYDMLSMNQGDAIGTGVYDDWREAGVYDELSKRLGYRYRLVEGTLEGSVATERIAVRLRIANDGFSTPINQRSAQLLLRNALTGDTLRLQTGIGDIRRAFPGPGETAELSLSAELPKGILSGRYDLLLALPDAHQRLEDRPEYSIRCANLDLWDAELGANDLRMRVLVDPRRAENRRVAELIYHEATTRHRTQYLLENADKLRGLPFDGISVNIPASWLCMKPGERWTFENSWASWIEPVLPVLFDDAHGMEHHLLLAVVDKPAPWTGDWSTAVANLRDLARVARKAGFRGILLDNEEYGTPLWDWPDSVDDPALGYPAHAEAAREKGQSLGAAMAQEFPDIELLILHGPYIADPGVPDFVRADQFGAGEFELYGPFYAGLLEGLGPEATVVDGGEVYALRSEQDFREHAFWRRWGLTSSAHDTPFLTDRDRAHHLGRASISFGVFPRPFPENRVMTPAVMRTALEHAIRASEGVVWLYSEEGASPWETDQLEPEYLDAIRAARAAVEAQPGGGR